MKSDDENPEQELTVETAADFEHLKADPEKLKMDPDPEVWKNWQGAVLLKDEIRRYCKEPIKLITPFEDKPEFLKPSSYHLRLGNKYRVNGVDYELSDNNRILKIPPRDSDCQNLRMGQYSWISDWEMESQSKSSI